MSGDVTRTEADRRYRGQRLHVGSVSDREVAAFEAGAAWMRDQLVKPIPMPPRRRGTIIRVVLVVPVLLRYTPDGWVAHHTDSLWPEWRVERAVRDNGYILMKLTEATE